LSEIEGSTRLLGRLGNLYGEALSAHRARAAAAAEAWDAELAAGRALSQLEAVALLASSISGM